MKICKIINFFKKFHIESVIWLIALIYLLIINPYTTHHFSFCLFKLMGFDFCPGCGLGLSISYLFHFDLVNSFQTHFLGIPAFIILSHRIIVLIKLDLTELKNSIYLNIKESINDKSYSTFSES